MNADRNRDDAYSLLDVRPSAIEHNHVYLCSLSRKVTPNSRFYLEIRQNHSFQLSPITFHQISHYIKNC